MSKKILLAIAASAAISLAHAPVAAAENITYTVASPISVEKLNKRINDAMIKGEDRISVTLMPGAENIPLTLIEWIGRVKYSEGQLFVKDTSKGWGDILKIIVKKTFEAIEEIVTGIIPAANDASNDKVDDLLDPAKKYNALLVSESNNGRTCWKKVEFYKRGSSAWTKAISDAKDINDTDLDYVGAGAETVSACAT